MRKKVYLRADGSAAHKITLSGMGQLLLKLPGGIAAALCAAALHNVTLPGGVAPVALSFLVGVPQGYYIYAAIGLFVGGWLIGGASAAVYLPAAAIVVTVRFLMGSRAGIKPTGVMRGSLAAAGISICLSKGLSAALLGSFSLTFALTLLAEAGLLIILSGFWRAGFTALGEQTPSAPGLLCEGVCLTLLALGFYSIYLGYISIGRIGIMALCIILAYTKKPSVALGGGAFLCCALLLAEPMFYFAAAGLMVATAAATAFSGKSKLICFAPFALAATVFAFAASGELFVFTYICELAIACAVFLVLPLKPVANVNTDNGSAASGRRSAEMLSSASVALESAAKLVDSCCTIDKVAKNSEKLVNEVANDVCRDCNGMSRCWVDSYGDTVEDFASLMRIAAIKGRLTVSDMSARQSAQCIRAQRLISSLNLRYRGSKARLADDRNVYAYKKQMCKQLSSCSRLLSRAAELTSLKPEADGERAAAIVRAAVRADIPVKSVSFSVCESGFAAVTAEFHADLRTKKRIEFEQLLYRQTKMKFAADPQNSGVRRVIFLRETEFEIAVSDFKRGRGTMSADIWTSFKTYLGYAYVLLMDGMGTGSEAAYDSAGACAMARRLLEAGADAQGAAEFINSALSIRDCEEAAISLDILEINMFTGKTRVFKAGGAPTYFYRSGELLGVSGPSLPIGIMDELCCHACEATLAHGDSAALISDGACAAFGEKLPQLLSSAHMQPDKVKQGLNLLLGGGPVADDITVLLINAK